MTNPLPVSIDVSAVPENPVGAGRYTLDLVQALAASTDADLTLWSRVDDRARWSEIPGIASGSVLAVAPVTRPLRLAWEQLRLPRLLANENVHVHHSPHYTMPRRVDVPCVVTIHDLTFFDHPEYHERSKVRVFRHAIARATNLASVLVCVSSQTAERLVDRFRPVGKVMVIPHGIDHDRFSDVVLDSDADFLSGLGVRPPYILFLGTVEPRKRIPTLIESFSKIATAHPETSLVLAGQAGWGSDVVDAALRNSAVSDRVLKTGYIRDAAVPALLRGAACVAYPSQEEGFGLPALEALACGTPLITTYGTPMAEMAGKAATLVHAGSVEDLATALDGVLHGLPDAAARRSLGIETAAGYSWAASAQRHLDAYRAALSDGRPNALGH